MSTYYPNLCAIILVVSIAFTGCDSATSYTPTSSCQTYNTGDLTVVNRMGVPIYVRVDAESFRLDINQSRVVSVTAGFKSIRYSLFQMTQATDGILVYKTVSVCGTASVNLP